MDFFFNIPDVYAGSITNAPRITSLLTNILQFLLSIVGIVGILGIVISGALYFFAAGDARKVTAAKKAIVFSCLGLVVALGGLVFVNTLAAFFK